MVPPSRIACSRQRDTIIDLSILGSWNPLALTTTIRTCSAIISPLNLSVIHTFLLRLILLLRCRCRCRWLVLHRFVHGCSRGALASLLCTEVKHEFACWPIKSLTCTRGQPSVTSSPCIVCSFIFPESRPRNLSLLYLLTLVCISREMVPACVLSHHTESISIIVSSVVTVWMAFFLF